MKDQELSKFNKMIADKATIISNLSDQYAKASTPEERMWCAIQMQNHANALRVVTERLGTDTKKIYGGKADEDSKG
ncbi:hypothetical protein L2520_03720 [Limosilactobacillus vaginalis]|uniref:Uncharacterized protein n=1 Tax=Limosilactobacillus vaginalis TaxID=1633 RepID=A0ABT4K6P5_9LACO|nr:hypothetical protein [Limosilactobacillus vaginalis]MCZ3746531.1 hypothetical protein [Limosilactobacillus vaginalis]MCZ3751577.1 hypothetical protein [Limosilactobacillus vaginalis]MCZ3753263.1 hypothetical protein [Limosilactobacillus vaginalis]MCZ3755051.1 hypothetical protein [Limosilactobacillus vaginalis]MCZ3756749.1 hypothetical protein [Limosilactobacillus vaginalis]